MYASFIIISFLLLIPVGVYLYFYLLRMADFWKLKFKAKKIKMAAALIAILAVMCSVNLFGFGALVVLHMIAAALCMEILNIIFAALHKHKIIKIDLWNKIFYCGAVPVIITALILGYGYFNMGNVIETDYTIHTEKPVPEHGYKIALVADLHFGTTMNEEKLKKYCNEIESTKPDLVVLCGDIVDERTTRVQMENAAKILGSIKSTYGTFYVYGNHDKSTYTSKPNFNEKQLKNQLVSNGIHVFEDEVYNVNHNLTIIGRKDKGFSPGIKRKTSEELLKNADTHNFLLLLDHQPSDLQQNSAAGIDLQLSGHTHGGQIWPMGLISHRLGFNQISYGYKNIGKYQIIVTSGMGGWGYPIRTGHHSEYVIVNVKK